jgi:ATP-dependent metalloprotease
MLGGQKRRMSSYSSHYSRRLEQAEAGSKLDSGDKQVDILRQLNRVDPESVIRWFESRPLPHHSSAAMAEYVKALVKVDRLDESALLRTLQRGNYWHL